MAKNEDKKRKIEKAINYSKQKNKNIEEYLSGGNNRYHSAIRSVRMVGLISSIPLVLYFILETVLLTAGISLIVTIPVERIIIFYLFVLGVTIYSIFALYLNYKLLNLSGSPNAIMAHILVIISSLVLSGIFTFICSSTAPNTVLSYTTGAVLLLGGLLTFLAACFSIQSIISFNDYKKWYKQF